MSTPNEGAAMTRMLTREQAIWAVSLWLQGSVRTWFECIEKVRHETRDPQWMPPEIRDAIGFDGPNWHGVRDATASECNLLDRITALTSRADSLQAERDELRAERKKYAEGMLKAEKELALLQSTFGRMCNCCRKSFTGPTKDEDLRRHITTECPNHPMRQVERERDAALAENARVLGLYRDEQTKRVNAEADKYVELAHKYDELATKLIDARAGCQRLDGEVRTWQKRTDAAEAERAKLRAELSALKYKSPPAQATGAGAVDQEVPPGERPHYVDHSYSQCDEPYHVKGQGRKYIESIRLFALEQERQRIALERRLADIAARATGKAT